MQTAILIACAATASAFLPRPRAHALATRAARPHVAPQPSRVAALRSSSDGTDYGDDAPPDRGILEEKHIYVGAMVSAQDSYEQWYAAEIVETKANEDGYTVAAGADVR